MSEKGKKIKYVPYTPAGSALVHLAAKTEKSAWENLLKDAADMPYKTVVNFKKRGYTVEKWEWEEKK